ncbi:MAG TPA: response regulator [Opitutaceae bacterium]|nr:response regulator [Opitutaceae bacterium]
MTDELIVLVEDNDDDVFFMRRALKGAGINAPVEVLTDGQQATDYLTGAGQFADRAHFPLPGIVFLDLKLPYCTGFEVLEAMRKKGTLGQMRVVILTSSPEERDRRRARELGAAAYLVKPPTPTMLKQLFSALSEPDNSAGELSFGGGGAGGGS